MVFAQCRRLLLASIRLGNILFFFFVRIPYITDTELAKLTSVNTTKSSPFIPIPLRRIHVPLSCVSSTFAVVAAIVPKRKWTQQECIPKFGVHLSEQRVTAIVATIFADQSKIQTHHSSQHTRTHARAQARHHAHTNAIIHIYLDALIDFVIHFTGTRCRPIDTHTHTLTQCCLFSFVCVCLLLHATVQVQKLIAYAAFRSIGINWGSCETYAANTLKQTAGSVRK